MNKHLKCIIPVHFTQETTSGKMLRINVRGLPGYITELKKTNHLEATSFKWKVISHLFNYITTAWGMPFAVVSLKREDE